jgi:hypothetical protein
MDPWLLCFSGILQKYQRPILAHAQKFMFIMNGKFRACAKIGVEIFAPYGSGHACAMGAGFVRILWLCLKPLTMHAGVPPPL